MCALWEQRAASSCRSPPGSAFKLRARLAQCYSSQPEVTPLVGNRIHDEYENDDASHPPIRLQPGNYSGTPSKPVTLLGGIKKRFAGSNVVYVQGIGLTGPATEPIPAAALYTDVNRKEHGLKGEYYTNEKLEGAPEISRTDSNVNFEWGYFGVTPQRVRNFSVR